MSRRKSTSNILATVREKAEKLLAEQPGGARPEASRDLKRLVHELEVNQIEAEAQNKELREANEAAERSLARYEDLYDFAPVGYFTLTPQGAIREANLTGARLLGVERTRLINRRLQLFVSPDSRPSFTTFLRKIFVGRKEETWEGTLLAKGATRLWVRIVASVEEERGCRLVVMDISKRRAAEEALRESEARYRLIVETAEEERDRILAMSSDLICIAGVDGYFKYVNPAWENTFGYPTEQFLSRPFLDFIHPEDHHKNDLEVAKLASGEPSVDFENRYIRRDGLIRTISWTASPMPEQGLMYCIGRDITSRKRAEEKERADERKYATVADNTYDWEYWRDPQHRFVYCSPSCERITGYKAEEFLADPDLLERIIHPDHRPGFILHKNSEHQAGHTDEMEFVIIRSDGTQRWIGHTCQAVYDESGVFMGMRGSNRDITERKQSEEKLVSEHQRLQTLLHNAPFGIMLIAENGLITYPNPKFTELLGYTTDDIPDGKTWFTKAYPDAKYRREAISAWIEDLNAAQIGEKRTRTFTVTCKDGTQKVIHFIPVQLPSGEHFVSLEDRTELHKYQEELSYLSIHDTLTGLFNRRSLEEMLNRAIARARRGVLSSLLYVDLDNFKGVNDMLGHSAGDKVLVTIANLLKEALRTEDILFRVGGDEFGVLLEGIDSTEAPAVAERLRSVVAAHPFKADKGTFPLSLSIGLVEINGLLTIDELLSRADTAMYQAKGQGGNSIVFAGNAGNDGA
jgi:diguanylate cyclase (GGDEF)-like protein/PAS domain S-box-containing protein